jgi:hypothetical protein
MNILVNPHSEQEEKALIAFLDGMKYDYRTDIDETEAFIDQYNKEIDEAEADIEAGNYLTHDEVEQLFAERRKKLNGD